MVPTKGSHRSRSLSPRTHKLDTAGRDREGGRDAGRATGSCRRSGKDQDEQGDKDKDRERDRGRDRDEDRDRDKDRDKDKDKGRRRSRSRERRRSRSRGSRATEEEQGASRLGKTASGPVPQPKAPENGQGPSALAAAQPPLAAPATLAPTPHIPQAQEPTPVPGSVSNFPRTESPTPDGGDLVSEAPFPPFQTLSAALQPFEAQPHSTAVDVMQALLSVEGIAALEAAGALIAANPASESLSAALRAFEAQDRDVSIDVAAVQAGMSSMAAAAKKAAEDTIIAAAKSTAAELAEKQAALRAAVQQKALSMVRDREASQQQNTGQLQNATLQHSASQQQEGPSYPNNPHAASFDLLPSLYPPSLPFLYPPPTHNSGQLAPIPARPAHTGFTLGGAFPEGIPWHQGGSSPALSYQPQDSVGLGSMGPVMTHSHRGYPLPGVFTPHGTHSPHGSYPPQGTHPALGTLSSLGALPPHGSYSPHHGRPQAAQGGVEGGPFEARDATQQNAAQCLSQFVGQPQGLSQSQLSQTQGLGQLQGLGQSQALGQPRGQQLAQGGRTGAHPQPPSGAGLASGSHSPSATYLGGNGAPSQPSLATPWPHHGGEARGGEQQGRGGEQQGRGGEQQGKAGEQQARISKQQAQEELGPAKGRHAYCTRCERSGHANRVCWSLHPELSPHVSVSVGRGGKEGGVGWLLWGR